MAEGQNRAITKVGQIMTGSNHLKSLIFTDPSELRLSKADATIGFYSWILFHLKCMIKLDDFDSDIVYFVFLMVTFLIAIARVCCNHRLLSSFNLITDTMN